MEGVIRPLAFVVLLLAAGASAAAQPPTPRLTGAVNDFANVIDPASEAELERRIASLMSATGDVVGVATVPDLAGFAGIDEFKVKLFENHGRGIGQKGKDNGLLIVVAVAERKIGIEVGYDLEQFVTDGFAGQTIRERIAPHFRRGDYGSGLTEGTTAIVNRIAEGRGVTLQGVPREAPVRRRSRSGPSVWPIVLMIIIFVLMSRGRRRRRRRYWGGSGWTSGVGPFGGGFGGGYGGGFGGFGGGFGGGSGGGFGGFGGGRSGGGGASGSW